MKKLILLAALTGLATMVKAQSQDFHSFKFDYGFGYALPTEDAGAGTKVGLTFTLQPHYRLTDDIAVGLRIEAAALGDKDNSGEVNLTALASTCATGEYYLSNRGFRPFIGAGLGIFEQESGFGNTNYSGVHLSNRVSGFGGFPEIGFEYSHLRVSVDYDVTGNGNNYAAIKIGSFFGGGSKHK
jgi:outer membrane protein W